MVISHHCLCLGKALSLENDCSDDRGSEDQGIRVIDVRHEVTTVFAADAVARLSGVPGVAAVTAGPGRDYICE